ncbi:MAG: VanZ family protein [Clostridia bacterium]|nr:VanZ family protein [Clostridia bacterium]
MQNIFIRRLVSIVLLCVWAVTIFCFSAQNADKSSDTSEGIVEKIISVTYPEFDELSTGEQVKTIDITTLIVRKLAHFLEYFILGALAFLTAINFDNTRSKLNALISIGFCVLYSITDEVHQYFVPGRACRFVDVCIDASGSALAVVILAVIIYKSSKKRGEPNAKKEVN